MYRFFIHLVTRVRPVWVLAFVFLAVLSAEAQRDVIITQADEEIRCRILDETPTRFIYAYVGKKGKVLRNEIFKNLVKDFKYNKYDSDLAVIEDRKSGRSKSRKESKPASLAEVVNQSTKEEKSDLPKSGQVMTDPPLEVKEAITKESISSNKKPTADTVEKLQESDNKPTGEAVAGVVEKTPPAEKEAIAKEILVENKKPVSEPAEKLPDSVEKPKDEAVAKAVEKPAPTEKEAVAKEIVIENKKSMLEPAEILPESSKKSKDKTVAKFAEQTTTAEEEIKQKSEKTEEVTVRRSTQSDPPVKTQEEEVAAKIETEKSLEIIPQTITLTEKSKVEEKAVIEPATNEFKNYLKWRVGAKGGIGNIRDNNFVANNTFGLYQEKLMKGWTFGADLAFFPMEGFGFGVVYTDFKSSNSASNINYINQMTGAEASGSISNNISRKFIGPALFLRKSIDYKTFVVLGGGPGMYLYSDQGDYNGAMFDYRGKQWGAAATLGLDFLLGNDIIGRDIILSLEAGYNYGRLNELDFGDGSGPNILNSPIVMDRLDFSVGLRFMRFPKYLKSSDN
ncbi:hypothetical protein [Jiulongibacter sediminis]|uniref:hypothetical protein n=1 Tax=Jiulongibacter sediminis TaxID=1605367 RepID=UPI0026ECF567|nr:hypothetical protein [Jiulongibacter sediminis]